MKYQIITTCGTSVLTNPARGDKDLAAALTKHSNAKTKGEIPADVYGDIERYWEGLIDSWAGYAEPEARKYSAELNCLLTWQRKNGVPAADCFCHLAHTDTLFGEMAAELVREWLKNNGYGCELARIPSLATNSLDAFATGLSNLAKWAFDLKRCCDYERIVFNTAGGFKSVSGFAQTLGTFIADETIYKFEGGDEVLSIPKLPIVWSETEQIKEHLDDYHRVSLGLPPAAPASLNPLWFKNGKFTPWGELAWENSWEPFYRESVLPFVYERVREGKSFRQSIAGLTADRVMRVNQAIDGLCRYVLSDRKECPKRLSYHSLYNEPMGCAYECYAWSDGATGRLYCNEKDGAIIVERFGAHLRPKAR